MKRRRYTRKEVALVRRRYGKATAPQIAVELGMSPRAAKSVYQLACRLGLRKLPRIEDELLDQFRQLHSMGLSDKQIADRTGKDRRYVSDYLHTRLGLPVNEKAILQSRRQAVRTQWARLGIHSAGELRSRSHRQYAIDNGWPADLRPRAVQIINALARGGAMTRRQIAATIGMPWKGSRKSLTSNDAEGSYLAHLAKRSLVTVAQRAHKVTGQGRGRSCHLYLLGPAALAILAERNAREPKRQPQPDAQRSPGKHAAALVG